MLFPPRCWDKQQRGDQGKWGSEAQDLPWYKEARRFRTVLQLGPAKPLDQGLSAKAQEARQNPNTQAIRTLGP